jgi:putative transposase
MRQSRACGEQVFTGRLRFLMHVLPRGFVRIRHFGWMANRHRTELATLCRELLGAESAPARSPDEGSGRVCPQCGGPANTVEVFTPLRLVSALRSRPHALNSS